MIEVFKTNVTCKERAKSIIDEIHASFTGHEANFDLQDCDNILRVKCSHGILQPSLIISLLKKAGFHAEVLPDIPCSANLWDMISLQNIQ